MATKKSSCTDVTKRSRSPVVLGAEMFSEFQDWCLRTYGDSGKTKTVTRRKYNKIMQTLLQNEESDSMYVDNSHINAKFKFWVKSKGFQVGSNILGEHKKGASGKPVLYVPVKSTVKCACLCVYARGRMTSPIPSVKPRPFDFTTTTCTCHRLFDYNFSVFGFPSSPQPIHRLTYSDSHPLNRALILPTRSVTIATPVHKEAKSPVWGIILCSSRE